MGQNVILVLLAMVAYGEVEMKVLHTSDISNTLTKLSSLLLSLEGSNILLVSVPKYELHLRELNVHGSTNE